MHEKCLGEEKSYSLACKRSGASSSGSVLTCPRLDLSTTRYQTTTCDNLPICYDRYLAVFASAIHNYLMVECYLRFSWTVRDHVGRVFYS